MCQLFNVCEQTTPDILEVACARGSVTDYLHKTPLIWVIDMRRDIMASLHPFVIHMQKLFYINANYMIKNITYPSVFNVHDKFQ